MPKGKPYSPELKTKIVLSMLREDKTVNQIASENSLDPKRIVEWRNQFLKTCSSIFSNHPAEERLRALKQESEEREEKLIKQIGELSVKLNWAEKKIKEFGFDD